MKYLKKFNESLEEEEEEGFELSSHKERTKTINLLRCLNFTDDEWEEIDMVMNKYSFKELWHLSSFYLGDKQVYIYKYEDDWFYVLYYEDYMHPFKNLNAIVYKCDEFNGLINCLHCIGKNYG